MHISQSSSRIAKRHAGELLIGIFFFFSTKRQVFYEKLFSMLARQTSIFDFFSCQSPIERKESKLRVGKSNLSLTCVSTSYIRNLSAEIPRDSFKGGMHRAKSEATTFHDGCYVTQTHAVRDRTKCRHKKKRDFNRAYRPCLRARQACTAN